MERKPLSHAPQTRSDIALCHAAQINLYTLAMNCRDKDIAERALFLLAEMEHYDEHTRPTPARRRQIQSFLRACKRLRLRVEAASDRIPELCEIH